MFSLPDRLFPRTDSGIGRRNRIRVERNTGIDVCLAARPADFNRRTAVFRCFRLCAGGDCLSQAPLSWTGSEIGPRDWIWSGFGAVVGSAAGCSWSGNRRIPLFPDWCGLRPLPDHLFSWADSGIERRNRIRAKENTGISVCTTVRLIRDNQRTLVFRRSRLGTVCGRVLRRTAVRTGSGIRR